jgi:hypothetical protein
MKKLLLLSVILLCLPVAAQHGTINIQTNLDSTVIQQYAIDTLESYQVGPGIIYTRFDITNATSTRHCYIYEVDLTNPYNTVEESHSTTMGNTERMADVIKALNYICRTEGAQEMRYSIYMSGYEEQRLKEAGKPLPTRTVDTGHDLVRFLQKDVVEYGQWQEFGWFRVKLYKKGTMHFEFIGEEGEKIWALFNQTVAKKRGWRVGNQTTKARTRKKNNNAL